MLMVVPEAAPEAYPHPRLVVDLLAPTCVHLPKLAKQEAQPAGPIVHHPSSLVLPLYL